MERRLLRSISRFCVVGFFSYCLLSKAQAKEKPNLPAGETLTLKASLERARRNNPRLLAAETELSIAKTHLRQAKSLFYPRVNLNMNYVRYRNETLGVLPEEFGSTI